MTTPITKPHATFDAFITHAAADLPHARKLAETLVAAGLEVFLFEWEGPGDVEAVVKGDALLASANGILVFSHATMRDSGMRDDYAALLWRVHHGGNRFIPVLVDDASLPPYAAIRKPVDLHNVDIVEYDRRVATLISVLGPPASAAKHDPTRIEMRMGFALDITSYSIRPAPAKIEAQQRLVRLATDILADLSVKPADTAQQGSGDGLIVFLPTTVEIHRVLPTLLHSWRDRLAADNNARTDRLRLRMSAVVGLVGLSPLGFSGGTVVELGRLLDCDPLRKAMADRPAADLAVLISGKLYDYVVAEGYHGLNPADFERRTISVKEYHADAWLWTPSSSRSTT